VTERPFVVRRGRPRQRRIVAQTMTTMMGDPLAQNVHVGKPSNNVCRIQR